MTDTTRDDLVKRLTIKAGVMEMGEGIAWGSDTAIMREAADRIEELEAKLAKAMLVVELIASADVDAVLGEAVDLSCEIIGELMEDEDDE